MSESAQAASRGDDHLSAALIAAGKGDYQAFERLYAMASPRLFAVCLRLLHRRDLAEDALQDAFVQIWHGAAYYDSQRGSAITWMAAIVRHRAIDLLRREAKDAANAAIDLTPEPMAPGPGPLHAALQSSNDDALRTCLDGLDVNQRSAIALAFFNGLTHQQLARALSVPLGTAKSLVRRGLQQLRRCLQA